MPALSIEEVIRARQADPEDCYFWATHQGAELDLLLVQNGRRIGFEFKYSSSPKLTKSMKISLEDLKLDKLNIIYPGNVDYALSKEMEVISLKNYLCSFSQ